MREQDDWGGRSVEIRQVQHFLSVARHGSLSAAASSLGITQSAVSSSLAALERSLGATLVDRAAGRRTAELTPSGLALLEPAKVLLDQVAAARAVVAAVAEDVTGSVRVATTRVPEQFGVLQTVLDLYQDEPTVQVSITSTGSDEVVEMVTDGRADFGLAAVESIDEPDLEIDVVLTSPMSLLCRADHRLARQEFIDAADLAGERILDFPATQRPRQLIDVWLQRGSGAGRATTSLENSDPGVVLDLVRAGRGVSYAPAAFAHAPLSRGLMFIPLRDAPQWCLALVTRRGGPTTPAAVKLYQEHLMRCRVGVPVPTPGEARSTLA